MSTIIRRLVARKVFNIRGEETIEIDVATQDSNGRASAPAGASRGKGEAIPYPKGSVDEAIKKVKEIIAPRLIGEEAGKLKQIDTILHEIDGTADFRNI